MYAYLNSLKNSPCTPWLKTCTLIAYYYVDFINSFILRDTCMLSNKNNIRWIYIFSEKNDTCTLIEKLFRPVRLFFLWNLLPCMAITDCTFIRDVRVITDPFEIQDSITLCFQYSPDSWTRKYVPVYLVWEKRSPKCSPLLFPCMKSTEFGQHWFPINVYT